MAAALSASSWGPSGAHGRGAILEKYSLCWRRVPLTARDPGDGAGVRCPISEARRRGFGPGHRGFLKLLRFPSLGSIPVHVPFASTHETRCTRPAALASVTPAHTDLSLPQAAESAALATPGQKAARGQYPRGAMHTPKTPEALAQAARRAPAGKPAACEAHTVEGDLRALNTLSAPRSGTEPPAGTSRHSACPRVTLGVDTYSFLPKRPAGPQPTMRHLRARSAAISRH